LAAWADHRERAIKEHAAPAANRAAKAEHERRAPLTVTKKIERLFLFLFFKYLDLDRLTLLKIAALAAGISPAASSFPL